MHQYQWLADPVATSRHYITSYECHHMDYKAITYLNNIPAIRCNSSMKWCPAPPVTGINVCITIRDQPLSCIAVTESVQQTDLLKADTYSMTETINLAARCSGVSAVVSVARPASAPNSSSSFTKFFLGHFFSALSSWLSLPEPV